jgi:hypothetical protein
MLVLVQLVERLRVLKEIVYKSVHQEKSFLDKFLLWYGVF